MTVNLKIEGGRKLGGTVSVKTAKNSAVALVCAALINRGETTLRDVPKIEDVHRLLEVLQSIGVRVSWHGNDLTLKPRPKLKLEQLDEQAAGQTRSALLLLGSLSTWAKEFRLPHPGGCHLGDRTVTPHLLALGTLGIKVRDQKAGYTIRAASRQPAEIILSEMSDTATENVLIAASGLPGQTTIRFAASNYMVQDLCHFLIALGIQIEGIGTSTLTVHGQSEIRKKVSFQFSEDPTEAMLFVALAATTNSSLTIQRLPIDFLTLELFKLKQMGFKYKILKRYQSANGYTNLVDLETRPSELQAPTEKIHPLPYPGINIDNLPFFVPIATQAKGTTLIHDWVYENRAIYYLELNKLGAKILLADPHRVYIEGPSDLRGTEVICPPALRPAAIILIAMLAARGTSILRNIYSINRGYEDLVTRLRKLGAKIEVVE